MLLGKLSFFEVMPEVVALEQIPLKAKLPEENIGIYLQIIHQRPASISQTGSRLQVVSGWIV